MNANKKKLIFLLIISVFLLVALAVFTIVNAAGEDIANIAEQENIKKYSNDLQLHFLNVGDGDCYFIKFGDTEILVDSGEKNRSIKEINNTIKAICKDKTLEYIIVTHGDSDHLGIMENVLDFFNKKRVDESNNQEKKDLFLEGYSVGNIVDFDSEYVKGLYTSNGYTNYIKARDSLKNEKTKYTPIASLGESVSDFESKTVTFTNSNGDIAKLHFLYNEYYFLNEEQKKDEYKNTSSICLLLEYGKSIVLLTGDLEEIDTTESPIEFKGETKLYDNYKNLLKDGVTLYKAAHHGSRSSNSADFIDKIHPNYVMISSMASSKNQYKFPSQQSLDNFFKYTGNIYITAYQDDNAGEQPYYGNTSFYIDKEENVVVSCENKSMQDVSLQDDTLWFQKNRTVPTQIIEFDGEGKENGNCMLVKAGNKELLYNAGVYESIKSRSFIDDIQKYCSDKKLEYVIVANSELDNISQMVGVTIYDEESKQEVYQNNGVFDLFEIGTLIDFGMRTKSSLTDTSRVKAYMDRRNKLPESVVKLTPRECETTPIMLYDYDGTDKDVYFQILNTKAYKGEKYNPKDNNNYSVSFVLTVGDYKALFTGDLNNRDGNEEYLVENNKDILQENNIDYYKLPNHGFCSDKKENTTTTESIMKLLKQDCIITMSGVCGTDYTGVTSGPSRFPHKDLTKDIITKTNNIYPTQQFDGKDFCEMYGTIIVVFTSEFGNKYASELVWENQSATEVTFENWLSENQ